MKKLIKIKNEKKLKNIVFCIFFATTRKITKNFSNTRYLHKITQNVGPIVIFCNKIIGIDHA